MPHRDIMEELKDEGEPIRTTGRRGTSDIDESEISNLSDEESKKSANGDVAEPALVDKRTNVPKFEIGLDINTDTDHVQP